ncbi:MAG: right-handed parallel beta-helix repeat-containing protein [Armatimonadetes bacterium]|nr:right-handed parallel beta-helix repeat-containing protein [Armatimonadota bacterium]
MKPPLVALLVVASSGLPAADFHVAGGNPAASDGNDGSAMRPWQTISHAARVIGPGDTVWIHDGVYRETVVVDNSGTGPETMLAFRAAPGERPVVQGSEPLTGWVRCADEPERAVWETDWPFAGIYPSLIACDDSPLIPFSIAPDTEALKPPKAYCQYFLGFGRGREAMGPGSFYYDEARKKLLVWLKGDEDPSAHAMEAAVRGCWLSQGDYILVEGLSFKYCPQVVPIGGVAVVVCGPGGGGAPADGCIVRHCEVSLSAFEGLVVRGGKRVSTLVEDCWVHHNGNGCGSFEGLADPDSDSWLIVRRCRLTDNNLFNWNPAWHCGGKHFGTRVLFEDCEFARNYNSPGLWFDIHQRDCIVNRCYAHQNGTTGLYYEIGETGAFINNLVEGGPHYSAIMLAGSSRTLVANNLVTSGARGITVAGESAAGDPVSRVNCHNAACNNVLLGRGQPLIGLSARGDLARGNASDHNLLWWLSGEGTGFFEAPGGPPTDLGQWQRERGLDLASRVADPRIEVQNGRWRRLPNSPSASGGKRLTAADLRAFFALRPMPDIPSEEGSSSIKDHRPPTEAFLAKVAELLAVPEGKPMPLGPLPHDDGASELRIANADFEDPVLPPNGSAQTVPGWTAGGGLQPLVWHAEGTGLWNWYMPSGNNALVLPPGEADVEVSQTLAGTLQPERCYRVSVWAGQRIDEAALPWPQVELALWAGDMRLGVVDIPEPTIKPHFGVWVETVLTCTSPAEVPLDQPLRIVLKRRGPGRVQVCFDSVRGRVFKLLGYLLDSG